MAFICFSPGTCSDDLIADNTCHGENNVDECAYDGGDCCSGLDESCWNCLDSACICHETAIDFCGGILKTQTTETPKYIHVLLQEHASTEGTVTATTSTTTQTATLTMATAVWRLQIVNSAGMMAVFVTTLANLTVKK